VTIPASSIDAHALEVHVLGGSKGESIVLKLPDGRWGVVDCYAHCATNSDTNPTIQFLRGRGVTRLLFVCLTHPHDDHFLGMVGLIEEFRPCEFWRFGCLSHEHVRRLVRYYELKALTTLNEEFSRSSRELLGIFGKALEGAKQGTMRVRRGASGMTLYPSPADAPARFQIECLSPTGAQVELYERAILECIGPDGRISRTLPHSRHNQISLTLKIVYGETRLILGGDLENEGWLGVIEEHGAANLNASAVKVSHHGSENGYCAKLWEHFSARGKPVALIAPYGQHRLPKPAALDHIGRHASAIYSTCRPRGAHRLLRAWGQGAPPLASRLAIRNAFAGSPRVAGHSCGRCALLFDDMGNVQVELGDPAMQLTD
jgi:beta-lactamase superfamily II metal-dependent hydrolase